jgi:cholesterol 7-desaturase
VWKSCEVNGLIFVWYHAENEEPWEIPEIGEISTGKLKFLGRVEFIINSHIQEVMENFSDNG